MFLACVTWLWVTSEPTIRLRHWFGIDAEKTGIMGFLGRLCDCCACSGFWIGLLFSWDPHITVFTSITAEVIYRMINRI